MTKYAYCGFDVNDETECLKAVKYNGMALAFVEHQTPEICCEAVKQDGRAIEYIRDKKMFERVAKAMDIEVE